MFNRSYLIHIASVAAFLFCSLGNSQMTQVTPELKLTKNMEDLGLKLLTVKEFKTKKNEKKAVVVVNGNTYIVGFSIKSKVVYVPAMKRYAPTKAAPIFLGVRPQFKAWHKLQELSPNSFIASFKLKKGGILTYKWTYQSGSFKHYPETGLNSLWIMELNGQKNIFMHNPNLYYELTVFNGVSIIEMDGLEVPVSLSVDDNVRFSTTVYNARFYYYPKFDLYTSDFDGHSHLSKNSKLVRVTEPDGTTKLYIRVRKSTFRVQFRDLSDGADIDDNFTLTKEDIGLNIVPTEMNGKFTMWLRYLPDRMTAAGFRLATIQKHRTLGAVISLAGEKFPLAKAKSGHIMQPGTQVIICPMMIKQGNSGSPLFINLQMDEMYIDSLEATEKGNDAKFIVRIWDDNKKRILVYELSYDLPKEFKELPEFPLSVDVSKLKCVITSEKDGSPEELDSYEGVYSYTFKRDEVHFDKMTSIWSPYGLVTVRMRHEKGNERKEDRKIIRLAYDLPRNKDGVIYLEYAYVNGVRKIIASPFVRLDNGKRLIGWKGIKIVRSNFSNILLRGKPETVLSSFDIIDQISRAPWPRIYLYAGHMAPDRSMTLAPQTSHKSFD